MSRRDFILLYGFTFTLIASGIMAPFVVAASFAD